MAARAPAYLTPAEYVAIERAAEVKSEYIDGEIVAMSGVSRAHSLIATQLVRALANRLDARPCEVHGSDMRVRVAASGLCTYPDASVVCGEPEFEDEHVDTLLNPTLIVEILSPSTEAYDRGDKFARFRRLASLAEYVLVSQDRPRVERFVREGEDWVYTAFDGLDATVELASVGCALPAAELYAKVSFQPRVGRPAPGADRHGGS